MVLTLILRTLQLSQARGCELLVGLIFRLIAPNIVNASSGGGWGAHDYIKTREVSITPEATKVRVERAKRNNEPLRTKTSNCLILAFY